MPFVSSWGKKNAFHEHKKKKIEKLSEKIKHGTFKRNTEVNKNSFDMEKKNCIKANGM